MGRRASFFSGGGAAGDDLWRAAHKLDDPRVRELLLKDPASAQLSAPHAAKGTTPLMAACKKSRRGGGAHGAQVVQHLLEFGADVHAVDRTPRRNTALHYAAYADAATAVEYLLHAGASAFALNHRGHSPLDVARLRGRKQAAAALTQHLRLKSGWLDVNPGSMLHFWRRRWCVVLACNAERSRFELCLFDAPDDLVPEHVLHIDTAARAEVVAESDGFFAAFTDKSYMFALDRPVLFQGVRGRRFSRDPATGLTQGHGAAQARKVLFAAESELVRSQWMAALGSGAHLAPSPAVFGQTYLNYPGTLFAAPQLWPNTTLPPQHQPVAPAFDVLPSGYNAGYSSFSPLQQQHQHEAPAFDVLSGGYGSYSSYSPPPRHHLESPTTLVPAFASSGATRTPASAPTFLYNDGDFRGSGSFAMSDDGTSDAIATSENAPPNSAPAAAHVQSPAKTGRDAKDCVICMDAARDALCVPCGHRAGCHPCLSAIKLNNASCPICRARVDSVVKIYEC